MDSKWLDPKTITEWWSSPTQKVFERPYTAEHVASLRDPFPENAASNAMAFKLRAILEKHRKAKTINLTTSPLEMGSQQMMAEAGMETAYVSGGIASFTAVTDPSADHADYTYDTLPKKVELLRRAQYLNARLTRAKGGDGEKCLLPLVADADSGFGLYTTVMKVVKLMVQSGAAGFHIDDLCPGSKRFDAKDGESWVIVPTNELLKRLTAARLQLDMMQSEAVVYYRADPHNANRITSAVDYRDRPFILGATVELPREYASLSDSPSRKQWKADAKFMTIDEAFKAAFPGSFDAFAKQSEGLNVSEALRVALKLEPKFYFSADAARNVAGYYLFRGCVEASIARSALAGKLVDVLWPNAGSYDIDVMERYAKGVLALYPDKWLGYNVTGEFPADGSRDDEVKDLNNRLAKNGYCWQFMPLAMFTATAVKAKETAKGMMNGGTYYYLTNVSRPAYEEGGDDSVEWWYKKPAIITDETCDVIGDCM